MPEGIVLCGSTGSIGRQALDVIRALPDWFTVSALSAHSNMSLLAEQIARFAPPVVCVSTQEKKTELERLIDCASLTILIGTPGLEEIASLPGAAKVLLAITGSAALDALMAALQARKTILLANKESLVMAGHIVMPLVAREKLTILPIDSEHNAIFQCLAGRARADVKKIYLTGTGGPFRMKTMADLESVSPDEAVNHPRWNMGQKISVDSATLMNKGLEAIEARWLFDLAPEQIDIRIHPEAVVHSMVEFIDHSVIAQLANPDMRLPIQYALTYPEVMPSRIPSLDFSLVTQLHFEEPDRQRFPCLGLALDALRQGGSMPCVLNAANEECVTGFLQGAVSFLGIAHVIEELMSKHTLVSEPSLAELKALEQEIRSVAQEMIGHVAHKV